MFFILLTITLVTNRLAQGDGQLCRLMRASTSSRPRGAEHRSGTRVGIGAGLRLVRTQDGPRERAVALRRPALQALICLFIRSPCCSRSCGSSAVSLDPRSLIRPDGLNLIPPGATFDAYGQVIAQPTSNPISFLELARNSFIIASATSLVSVSIGRHWPATRSPGCGSACREALMLSVLAVLMLPAVATIAPLFVLLDPDPDRLPFGAFDLDDSIGRRSSRSPRACCRSRSGT